MVRVTRDQTFGERLKLALEDNKMTQVEFAKQLGSRSASSLVSQWISGHKQPRLERIPQIARLLDVSADWLLGLDAQTGKYEGITWVERIPNYLPKTQRKYVEDGIRLFRDLVRLRPFGDLIREGHRLVDLYAAFRLALQVGAFAITDVRQDTEKEQKIREIFKIKNVFVADVPNHDGTIVRAEYISFLAATTVLPNLVNPGSVGLGHGYTLLRMASIGASIGQLGTTSWVPLTVAHQKYINIHSANYIALMMAQRHQGTQALYLPFSTGDDDQYLSVRDIEEREEVLREVDSLGAIFTSCNGPGRTSKGVEPADATAQFRTADYLDLGDMRLIYEKFIKGSRQERMFAGEILGLMIRKDGTPIDDENVRKKISESFYQVSLDKLKATCDRGGQVWLLGARHYKIRPIFTALRSGLANALVIDKEIAEGLIDLNSKEPALA